MRDGVDGRPIRGVIARRALAALALASLVGACGSGAGSGSPSSARASDVVDRAAVMQLRPVLEVSGTETPGNDGLQVTCGEGAATPCTPDQLVGATPLVFQDAQGTRYRLDAPVADGADVVSAEASEAQDEWVVNFQLSSDATARFEDLTTRLASLPQTDPTKHVAIVADGIVVSIPVVQAPITSGSGQISRGFTRAQAQALAAELGGASS
jgi:preprotein translocase subunit SecD